MSCQFFIRRRVWRRRRSVGSRRIRAVMAKVRNAFVRWASYMIAGVRLAQNPARRRPRAALHKSIPATQPAAATHGGHRSTRATLIREAPCPSPCAPDNTKSPSFAISNAHGSARAGHGRRIPDRRSAQRSRPHAPSWCRGPTGLVADPRRVRVRTGAEN